MNDHSRSVDIRHHSLKQDYVEGTMRIGGVASLNNTSDILTKILQPPLHAKHCTPLHILTPTNNKNEKRGRNANENATTDSLPTPAPHSNNTTT
jgi:hypothetical protein